LSTTAGVPVTTPLVGKSHNWCRPDTLSELRIVSAVLSRVPEASKLYSDQLPLEGTIRPSKTSARGRERRAAEPPLGRWRDHVVATLPFIVRPYMGCSFVDGRYVADPVK